MTKEEAGQNQFRPQAAQLLEPLRQHPEMRARVQSILEIACREEGPLKTADEVEELLNRVPPNAELHYPSEWGSLPEGGLDGGNGC